MWRRGLHLLHVALDGDSTWLDMAVDVHQHDTDLDLGPWVSGPVEDFLLQQRVGSRSGCLSIILFAALVWASGAMPARPVAT